MFRVIFGNIYQGLHFAGKVAGTDVFYGYKPSKYIEWFKDKNPEILSLVEVPLDNADGQSVFLEQLAKSLEIVGYKVYVNDESWIMEGKYYGTAILSKFPVVEYESFNLPNPKLEVDRPDGSHWIMHDKGAQRLTVEIGDYLVTIYNLQYFPFHHFRRSIGEEEFIPMRKALSDVLVGVQGGEVIVSGDFNNRGLHIKEAFPELFEEDNLKIAVEFDERDYGSKYDDGFQIDHILHSSGLKPINSEVHSTYSDHCTLVVDFE